MKGTERKHIDRRVVERYIEKGIVKDTDYAAHLKALPDEGVNAQWVQLDMHDAELGDTPLSDVTAEEET